jgi:hypothetical protein
MRATTRPLLAVAAVVAFCAAAPARAGDMLPKTTTIVGTLASWGVAAWKGAPVGDCLVNGARGNDGWGVRVQEGKDKELSLWSLGAVRRDCHLTNVAGFDLDVAPVVSVGRWDAAASSYVVNGGPGVPLPVIVVTPAKTAWDVAFVPMLHWRLPLGETVMLDTEFGIGPAWLSDPQIGTRFKSTNFQFSDHLGLGLSSRDGHWRIEAAYRHVSNADIRKPNNAVDFKGVVFEWKP